MIFKRYLLPLAQAACFSLLVIVSGCADEDNSTAVLTVDDFRFNGTMGSEGAQIERIDTNHFKVTLDHAPNQPGWPNNLYFEIAQNAKGNDLRLEVEFEDGTGYAFNSYFQSWSYDEDNWRPIHWEHGRNVSTAHDELMFPVFTEDKVFVGHQVPMSFKTAEAMKKEWAEHPDVTLHTIGHTLQGRPMYRLEISSADSPVAPENRWSHYFANQHPGEHNAQWRMAGMVDWILSEDGMDYRQHNVSHFILFMSPDASANGWYRVNQDGMDMNRSYRAEGSDQEEQVHEAYVWQKDFEELMASEVPVTSIWAMHTWQGLVEPLLREGPEMGTVLGPWTEFRDLLQQNDPDTLIKTLAVRDGGMGYGPVSWTDGPHHQFGLTAILCEGAGSHYTREENITAGVSIIKSMSEYYSVPKE
ncbi:MAG: M14 family zinc carboxypeptidase [Balneolales bacterium]